MTTIYTVIAHTSDGQRTMLKAFSVYQTARHYVERITKHEWGDDGRELPSACDILDITSIYIEPIQVDQRKQEPKP